MNTINFQQLHETLLGFIQKSVREEAEAKDILQDVFLKMQLKLPQLQEPSKLLPWVFQIARNVITDHFRARKKQKMLTANFLQQMQGVQNIEVLESDFKECVPEFLETLPEKYKEALYLVEVEGMSQKELAAQLQLSHSGAKSRVQRGREKLKEALLECCHISTDAYGNVVNYQSRRKCDEIDC